MENVITPREPLAVGDAFRGTGAYVWTGIASSQTTTRLQMRLRATGGLRPPLLIRQSLFAGQDWGCIASATQPEPRRAYAPRS